MEEKGTFFESKRRHAVTLRSGKTVVGTVFWNRLTGSAWVASAREGLLRIPGAEAKRVRQQDEAFGRPRLFNEPTKAVLLTLPQRLLALVHPPGRPRHRHANYSLRIANLIERGLKEEHERD